MAKTQTIEIPDELKNLESKALERSDRFVYGTVQAHKSEPSKARKKLIKEMSLFGYLATIWRTLTDEQKNVWRIAGGTTSLTNWQLFVSDNAARLRSELELNTPPSYLWQVRAGYINITSPACSILLKQEHPINYWVTQKIAKRPWARELVYIEENFSLPIDLEIRYKSNLTACGSEQRARYYVEVWTSYQGEDIMHEVAIDFDPVKDWTFETVDIASLRGIIIGYTIYIDVFGYTGTLAFDNLAVVHGGTNWARDPRCDEIDKTFKKAFAIVPPYWIPVDVGDGVSYSSVYPPSL